MSTGADAADPDANRPVELLVFDLDGRTYGVETGHVAGVVEPDSLTRVPLTGDHVAGVTAVEGTVTVVVDARAALTGRDAEPASSTPGPESDPPTPDVPAEGPSSSTRPTGTAAVERLVVLDGSGRGAVGLRIVGTTGVAAVPAGSIRAASDLQDDGPPAAILKAFVDGADGRTFVLDPDAIRETAASGPARTPT